MHFEERIVVPVPIDVAWDFLWQTQRVAACLPGCKDVQELEPGKAYRVQFEDRIGPYRVHFDLDALVEEAIPGERIRLFCSGKDRILGASQRVNLTVALRENAPRSTALDIDADVEVLGKVATLGQFAIKRKAKDVVAQFARNIQAELQPAAVGER